MKKTLRPLHFMILYAGLALLVAAFSACSKSSQASMTINLTNAPSRLTVNQSVSLTATVANDSSNEGVDWSSTGGGSFNPTHTASGGTTIYTAPATSGTVTITATATANTAVKANATVTIVPVGSNSMLSGTYVFSVQGVDSNGNYTATGTIVADGNGNITSGEQDYADVSLLAGPDAVTGTYSIGPDGIGSITLNVNDTSLPQNGVETFSIAVTSASHALIIQFDGTAASSGSLDLQAASALNAAAINGAFAFTVQGIDTASQVPASFGGVLLMSASSGTIAGGVYYENEGGSTSTSSFTGTMTAPDSFGRGTMGLTNGLGFSYYAVQGEVLRLVGLTAPSLMIAGSMYGQGSAGTNGTFSSAALTGNYVFFEAGGTTAGGMAMAGQFSANGAGNFTAGFADTNDAGTVTTASIAAQSAYSISGNGSGTLTLPTAVDSVGNISSLVIFAVDPSLNLLDPTNSSGGGGALVMDYDSTAVATGFIVPQSSGVFAGNYAVNLQFVSSSGEDDWVGQSVAASGALTGTVDINDNGATSAGVALTGTFTADASHAGRWTGGFTVNSTTYSITYYQVSPSMFVILDVDSADIGIGIMEAE